MAVAIVGVIRNFVSDQQYVSNINSMSYTYQKVFNNIPKIFGCLEFENKYRKNIIQTKIDKLVDIKYSTKETKKKNLYNFSNKLKILLKIIEIEVSSNDYVLWSRVDLNIRYFEIDKKYIYKNPDIFTISNPIANNRTSDNLLISKKNEFKKLELHEHITRPELQIQKKCDSILYCLKIEKHEIYLVKPNNHVTGSRGIRLWKNGKHFYNPKTINMFNENSSNSATVYTLWFKQNVNKILLKDVKRSLKSSLKLWNHLPIFIWGSSCEQIKKYLNLSCIDAYNINTYKNKSSCENNIERLFPGNIYASDYLFNEKGVLSHVFDIRRFLVFKPLILLGVKKAIYLDADAFVVRQNAAKELLYHDDPFNKGIIFTKRCSFKYADRLNFSNPNIMAKSKYDTVNTGVISYTNLKIWCENWGKNQEKALKLYKSEKPITGGVFCDQTIASGIFAQESTKTSFMYNFRRISGDNEEKCKSHLPISIEHSHVRN